MRPTGCAGHAGYHDFRRDNINDLPASVIMTPLSTNPPDSRDLGSELNLQLVYKSSPRLGLMFGYSYFFTGDCCRTTAGLPYRDDADFFCTEFTVNF